MLAIFNYGSSAIVDWSHLVHQCQAHNHRICARPMATQLTRLGCLQSRQTTSLTNLTLVMKERNRFSVTSLRRGSVGSLHL